MTAVIKPRQRLTPAFPFSTILQSECGWPMALIQTLPGVRESACTLSPVRIKFWCTARVGLGCRSNWTCFTAWNTCPLPPPSCSEGKVIKSLIRQGYSLLFFTSRPIITSCALVWLSVAQICHKSSGILVPLAIFSASSFIYFFLHMAKLEIEVWLENPIFSYFDQLMGCIVAINYASVVQLLR